MDWDRPLVLSKSIVLQPVAFDGYAAKSSFSSRTGVSLDGVTLAILSCFVRPCLPRQAREVHQTRWDIDESAFVQQIASLLDHGLLRAADGDDRGLSSSDYGHVLTHHPMLRDWVRLDAYRTAIERHVKGKRVLEIGCGTGVLSMFAAKAGAAQVTAVEETDVILLAAELFAANGVEVTLIGGNSLDLSLDEPAEVLIHELIGHEPLAENAVRFLADARHRLLAPGGRMIPDVIEVWCRGIERKGWSDPSHRLAETEELERRYGLDFGPYRERMGRVPALPTFVMQLDPVATGARTEDVRLHRADFSSEGGPFDVDAPVEVDLPVVRGGLITSVAVWFRARMDEASWLTNAPEAPATHWALAVYDLAEPRRVEESGRLRVRATMGNQDGLERMLLHIVE